MAKKSPATNAASGKRVKKSSSPQSPAKKPKSVKSAPAGKAKPVKSAKISPKMAKKTAPAKTVASPRPAKNTKAKNITKALVEAPVVLPPAPAAVGTSESPKKNQAGLNRKDLENFRSLLLEKRREIVGDMSSMEREALGNSGSSNLSNLPVHMADMGTDNYEQEFTLGLVEKDRILLREINAALAKIQDGSYGVCEATGKPIGKPRLEAKPWAKHSIEYTRKMEQGRRR